MIHEEEKQPPTDDDEEKLVQQVLAENPPEDKGERDEWAKHVGWHRREDIGVGVGVGVVNRKEDVHSNNADIISGKPPKAETVVTDRILPKNKIKQDVSKSLRGGSHSKESDGLNASDLLLVLIAIGCVFSTLRAIRRKRHSKHRTS